MKGEAIKAVFAFIASPFLFCSNSLVAWISIVENNFSTIKQIIYSIETQT